MKRINTFLVAVIGLGLGFLPSLCHAEVTLPDTGVDVSGYITAGIVVLGAVVATAMGGYVAFLLIRKACKAIGRAFSV